MSNAVVNGLAGAGGGIIAQIITYPLQTVNTRQQTERVAKKVQEGSSLPPPTPGSTLVQILQVVRTEGWGGLYSGLKPSLFGTAASQNERVYRCTTIVIPTGQFPCLIMTREPPHAAPTVRERLQEPLLKHKDDGMKRERDRERGDPSKRQFHSSYPRGDYPNTLSHLHGIYYYFYQVFKNKAEAIAVARRKKGRGDGTVGVLSWLVVAAIAGSLNVLLTNPIWVLVTRMQTHTQAERKIMEAKREALLMEASESKFIGSTLQDKLAELDSVKPSPYKTLHAAREVYNEAGITGFWKGLVPTLIMVCNPSIQFMIYETSLKHLRAKRATNKQGRTNVTALEVFLLGALAKLGATVSTYPLLVVKSRLQAKQEIGGNILLRYSGTLDAIAKMIRYEGLSSFYKGMSTKIFQSVLAASVLFMVKEELVKTHVVLADKWQKIHLSVSK